MPSRANPPRPIEGPLFAAGVAIWAVIAAGLSVMLVVAPNQARAISAGLVAELLTGREGGLPVALAAGGDPWLVWAMSALQDLGTAFLSFPIFLFLLHKYHDRDFYVMRRLRAIEAKAAARRGYTTRWGPFGLCLFMLVPFLVNGPFIALIVGRLAGIKTRQMLAPIIATTVIVAGIWTFFIDAMLDLLETVHPHLGRWAAALAIGIIVVIAGVDFLREQRRARSLIQPIKE